VKNQIIFKLIMSDIAILGTMNFEQGRWGENK
jgi:hypothetical protein